MMQILLSVIAKELKQLNSSVYYSELGDASIEETELLVPFDDKKSNCLYVCTAEEVKSNYEADIHYLIIGKCNITSLKNCIVLPNASNKFQVITAVQRIINKITNWYNSMLISIIKCDSIHDMFTQCSEIFGISLMLIDYRDMIIIDTTIPNLKITLDGSFFSDVTQLWYIDNSSFPQELYKLINESSDPFFYTIQQKEPKPALPAIICPLILSNVLLLILDLNGSFYDPHLFYANILMKCIAERLMKHPLLGNSGKCTLPSFLKDIVTGKNVNRSDIIYRFGKMDWQEGEKYSFLAFRHMKNYKIFAFNINPFLHLLKRIFNDSYYEIIDNDLICITHNNSFFSLNEDKKNELINILKQYQLICGCSKEFYSFHGLRSYYMQTIITLRHSMKSDKYYPLSLYEDKIAKHVPAFFNDHHEGIYFAHPIVETLWAYDLEHKSDLVLTLYHYLVCERSYALTANALNISKSTLHYRLNKIKSLINCDFESLDKRMNLLVSTSIVMKGVKAHEIYPSSMIDIT